MKNINSTYNKLKNCDWYDTYIYSCDKKYRFFVSYDINTIYVEKKFKIFKWEYWDLIFHWHPSSTKDKQQFYDYVLDLFNKNNILIVKKTLLYSTIKVISIKKFKTVKKRYNSNLFRKYYIININLENKCKF